MCTPPTFSLTKVILLALSAKIILSLVIFYLLKRFGVWNWLRKKLRDWLMRGYECGCRLYLKPEFRMGVHIALNRSAMILACHNNGERFITIGEKKFDLEQFCEVLREIIEENKNSKFVKGFINRAAKLIEVEGRYKYTKRLALPKNMASLDRLCNVVQNLKIKRQLIEVLGTNIDLIDIVVLTEYLLTTNDLLGRLDPRLILAGKIKSLALNHNRSHD